MERYRWENNYGGVTFAIKKTTYRAREFSILTKLSHKNIVPLLAMMTGEQHTLHRRRYFCYYFMPKLTGDLARMVTDCRELYTCGTQEEIRRQPKGTWFGGWRSEVLTSGGA